MFKRNKKPASTKEEKSFNVATATSSGRGSSGTFMKEQQQQQGGRSRLLFKKPPKKEGPLDDCIARFSADVTLNNEIEHGQQQQLQPNISMGKDGEEAFPATDRTSATGSSNTPCSTTSSAGDTFTTGNSSTTTPSMVPATNDNGVTVQPKAVSSSSSASSFFASLHDADVIERVRTTIKHSHVFKLPTRQTGSIGWRGADWKEKVWHGTVKVVDRNDMTAVLLVDSVKGTIYAVCPIRDGVNAVERCVDSSRYFVLRIENQAGRHMFIGLAFNERNDAFDFNTALQDAQKEREYEKRGSGLLLETTSGSTSFSNLSNYGSHQMKKDYSLKEGQKIKVNIPKRACAWNEMDSDVGGGGGTMAFANFQMGCLDNKDDLQNSNLCHDEKAISNSSDGVDSFARRPLEKKNNLILKKRDGKSRGGIGSSSGGIFLLKPSAKDTPARKQL